MTKQTISLSVDLDLPDDEFNWTGEFMKAARYFEARSRSNGPIYPTRPASLIGEGTWSLNMFKEDVTITGKGSTGWSNFRKSLDMERNSWR